MTAEAIARVVDDLRRGRFQIQGTRIEGFADMVRGMLPPEAKVVDATAIFQGVLASDEVRLYEDHPCITPPWTYATFGYVNGFGNVHAMVTKTYEITDENRDDHVQYRWETDNPVDWDRVRWTTVVYVFIGGRSLTNHRALPTSGPHILYEHAIYDDGSPADLHWVQVDQRFDVEDWTNAQLTLLGSLNFLNCRNVELVEPERPRPQRRRLDRIGVKVTEINVFPMGKQTRSGKGKPSAGVPLTPVRGHFAHYGACCPHHEPRGLLFGKYEGKFYVPQHARGSTDHGEYRQESVNLRAVTPGDDDG